MLYIALGMCALGIINIFKLRERKLRKRYLPVKDINMSKEQRDYISSKLYNFKCRADNIHLDQDAKGLIEKLYIGTLDDKDIKKINKYLLEYRLQIQWGELLRR